MINNHSNTLTFLSFKSTPVMAITPFISLLRLFLTKKRDFSFAAPGFDSKISDQRLKVGNKFNWSTLKSRRCTGADKTQKPGAVQFSIKFKIKMRETIIICLSQYVPQKRDDACTYHIALI